MATPKKGAKRLMLGVRRFELILESIKWPSANSAAQRPFQTGSCRSIRAPSMAAPGQERPVADDGFQAVRRPRCLPLSGHGNRQHSLLAAPCGGLAEKPVVAAVRSLQWSLHSVPCHRRIWGRLPCTGSVASRN